jgi:adenylyl cyclase-associated protein
MPAKVDYDVNAHRHSVTGLDKEQKDAVTVTAVELRDTVYVEKATGGTLLIKGKVNAITLNNCAGLTIACEDVISVVEIINSKKVKLYIGENPLDSTVAVGTIIVDKSNSIQIFGNNHFKTNGKVMTSSSSSINLNIPEGDDFKEYGLAETITHKYVGGKVISEISSELSGH